MTVCNKILITLFSMIISSYTYAQRFPSEPEKAEIYTNDIDNFWKTYDLYWKDTTVNLFDDYLKNGSAGLKDFIPDRIISAAELKNIVSSEKVYYGQIRLSSLMVSKYIMQIRASYFSLKYLYPSAIFPPVYFVIGRTTSGGTASQNGLIIGTEVFSISDYKTKYGRPSLKLSYLPFIVAHEIIHFLQKNNSADSTLLKMCIREGSADFIAELTAGEDVKLLNGENVYSYGDNHEKELWLQFKEVMNNKTYGEWLYGQTTGGRPQNLGYWMGYKIAQSYYKNAKNKRKAIYDILNISNYKDFLNRSEYGKNIS